MKYNKPLKLSDYHIRVEKKCPGSGMIWCKASLSSDMKEKVDSHIEAVNKLSRRLKFIHYFWTGDDYKIVDYISVLTGIYINNPDEVRLWVDRAPKNNVWWEKTIKLPRVRVVKAPAPAYSLSCAANHSDYLAYYAIAKHGGVYLDIDALSIRPLLAIIPDGKYAAIASRQYSGFNPDNPVAGKPDVNGTEHFGISVGMQWGEKGNPFQTDCLAIADARKRPVKKFTELGTPLALKSFITKTRGVHLFHQQQFAPFSYKLWAKYFEDYEVTEHLTLNHYYCGDRKNIDRPHEWVCPCHDYPTFFHRSVKQAFHGEWDMNLWESLVDYQHKIR